MVSRRKFFKLNTVSRPEQCRSRDIIGGTLDCGWNALMRWRLGGEAGIIDVIKDEYHRSRINSRKSIAISIKIVSI